MKQYCRYCAHLTTGKEVDGADKFVVIEYEEVE